MEFVSHDGDDAFDLIAMGGLHDVRVGAEEGGASRVSRRCGFADGELRRAIVERVDVDAVALVIARIATLRPRSSSNVHDARASRSVVFIRTRDVNRRVDRARGDSSRVVIGRMTRRDTRSTTTNEDE